MGIDDYHFELDEDYEAGWEGEHPIDDHTGFGYPYLGGRGRRRPAKRETDDPEIRGLRRRAHESFDRLWRGSRAAMSRGRAYRWLAGALGVPEPEAHFGMMLDPDVLREAIRLCDERLGRTVIEDQFEPVPRWGRTECMTGLRDDEHAARRPDERRAVMAKAGRSDQLTTGKFRVRYSHVFVPRENRRDKTKTPTYEITAMIPKGDPCLSPLRQAAEQAAFRRWPDGPPTNIRSPFKDGDTDVLEDGTPRRDKYPEQAGHIVVRFWSYDRPKVVDQDLNPIIDRDGFYPGCYARVATNAFTYGGEDGNRAGVSFGLVNAQKMDEGEPFGFRSRPEDDFEKVAREDADWGDKGGGEGGEAPQRGKGLFG